MHIIVYHFGKCILREPIRPKFSTNRLLDLRSEYVLSLGHFLHDWHVERASAFATAAGNAFAAAVWHGGVVGTHRRRDMPGIQFGDVKILVDHCDVDASRTWQAIVL